MNLSSFAPLVTNIKQEGVDSVAQGKLVCQLLGLSLHTLFYVFILGMKYPLPKILVRAGK